MQIFKKISIILSVLIFLLVGCSPQQTDSGQSEAPSEGGLQPVTTPYIPQGVVSDVIPGRFAVVGDKIYYALNDSILCYDGEEELVLTADEPSYLCVVGNSLYFRCVSARENYQPVEYEVRCYDLVTKNVIASITGQINCIVSAGGKAFCVADYSVLSKLENGTCTELERGEISLPYAVDNSFYIGINGDLCKYDAVGESYSVLINKCYPVNISADRSNVYFSTEENNALSTFNIEQGTVITDSINNFGLVLDNGKHYYVINNDGFALVRASDNGVVVELGELQNCSAPLFLNNKIYFYINSDQYFGLISYDIQSKEIVYLTQSEG